MMAIDDLMQRHPFEFCNSSKGLRECGLPADDPIHDPCSVRCHSIATLKIGARWMCAACGFNWHRDSHSVDEEEERRRKSMVR